MTPALIAFEIAARINKVDVDCRTLAKEFSVPSGKLPPEELLRIAKRYGFKVKIVCSALESIAPKYPLPAIGVSDEGEYFVALKVDGKRKKALLFDPGLNKTYEQSFDELAESGRNRFIVLRHKLFSSQVPFGFRWFLREFSRYRRIIGEVLLGSFIIQLFGLITPLFTQVILDKVIVHHSLTTLDILAIAFLAVVVFEFLLNVSRNYIFIHTAGKLDAKLGAKLFRHLFSLPFMYFEARKVGNIAARARELDTIREFISNKAVSVIIDLFFSLTFVAVMFLYSVRLALVAIGFVSLIALIYVVITPELRSRLEEKFKMMAASNSYLVESVTGMLTVKSMAIESAMQRKWEEHLANYVQSGFKLSVFSNISGSLSKAVQKLMTITILYLGVKSVLQHELTIGQLIAFQMFAGQFSGPVLRLVNLWNEFQQALLSVNRLGDILNHPVELTSAKAITLPFIKGEIKIDNVTFAYGPNKPKVLDGITITIAAGQQVGIVGGSGSGKSTLARLIQRLYLVNEGAIFIDDVDIRYMNPVWLRHHIGVVLQENFLFSGTIRDNIGIAQPDATMEQIFAAARLAGAHEFISRLPEGYDTLVGERGASLSGGQKQRVAIARALITGPGILIFDEATSSLDYRSEHIIRNNMKAITKGRTTIIIAHRLQTVHDCDRIIVMENGRIVETGTHDELMEKKGSYFQLQSGEVVS